jgi:hypothetical protein
MTFMKPTLVVVLLLQAGAAMAQECYDGKDAVPLDCLRMEASRQYQRGLTDACKDAGGVLIQGVERPMCFVAVRLPGLPFESGSEATVSGGAGSIAAFPEGVPGFGPGGIPGVILLPGQGEWAAPEIGRVQE